MQVTLFKHHYQFHFLESLQKFSRMFLKYHQLLDTDVRALIYGQNFIYKTILIEKY